MTIKRVGPLSSAKIAGLIYAALGLLAGAAVSLFAVLGAVSGMQRGVTDQTLSPVMGAAFGVGAIIAFPIFYGAIGFVFALIGAWLYNLFASWVGGIEVDIS